MDALYILASALGFVVLAVIYLKFFAGIVVSRYEYLILLSFSDWRVGRNLMDEMRSRKGRRIRVAPFFLAMLELEKEGLVESCVQLRTEHTVKLKERMFRITNEGLKARAERFDSTGRLRTVRRSRIVRVEPNRQ